VVGSALKVNKLTTDRIELLKTNLQIAVQKIPSLLPEVYIMRVTFTP